MVSKPPKIKQFKFIELNVIINKYEEQLIGLGKYLKIKYALVVFCFLFAFMTRWTFFSYLLDYLG